MGLLVVIVSIFFVVMFILIMFGVLTKPKLKRLVISPGKGGYNKTCFTEKVSCHTDQDCINMCSEAQEGEEVVCQAIPDTTGLTAEQRKILGASGPECNGSKEENESNPNCQNDHIQPNKFCIPAKAKESLKECNQKHGGIPVFSGWGGAIDHMEFDCLCTYPLWASSRVCDANDAEGIGGGCTGQCLLNPGICQGGTFNWDLTKKSEAPIAQLCECQDGDVLVISNEGLPRCVPSRMQAWYTDLDIDTGLQGGQQRIQTRGVPISSLNKTTACNSHCPNCQIDNCDKCPECKMLDGACVSVPNMYTQCGDQKTTGGCCMLPDAVCCGEYCCPKGYICDTDNLRCIKKACCDDGTTGNGSSEHCTGTTCCPSDTPCGQGCCPVKDGVCCPDSKTCCPKGYTCDPSGKGCNPAGTEFCKNGDDRSNCQGVKSNKCPAGSDNTTCGQGCCPLPDANCCGDYCCPSEYPVCNFADKSCAMFNSSDKPSS